MMRSAVRIDPSRSRLRILIRLFLVLGCLLVLERVLGVEVVLWAASGATLIVLLVAGHVRLRQWLAGPKRRAILWSLGLLVVATGIAAPWWWVTWPERTSQRFASLVRAGKFDQAQRMAADLGSWSPPTMYLWQHHFRSAPPVFHPRTAADWIYGTQRFDAAPDPSWGFTAERGKIRIRHEGGSF